jgi:hypothetical protein
MARKLAKAGIVVSAVLFLVGLGAAVCGSCNYNAASSIVEGTPIHLQGPSDSGSQDRPLNYEWVLYTCPGNQIATFNFVSGGYQAQDLYFYAPPAGNYRVALTVRDKAFASTCFDTKDICFTTIPGTCPTLCCEEICEDDTPDYTKCPWHMVYTPATIVPGWQYKWLVNGVVVDTDTASPISVNIDWSNGLLYPPGVYTLTFEIWAPNPVTGTLERILNCVDSCTCSTANPALAKCQVRVVQKPAADISVVP